MFHLWDVRFFERGPNSGDLGGIGRTGEIACTFKVCVGLRMGSTQCCGVCKKNPNLVHSQHLKCLTGCKCSPQQSPFQTSH